MQINIAVCDDDVELCSTIEVMVAKLLKGYGIQFNLDIFYTGNSLCEEMQKTSYDLIFLDIELPDKSGIEIGKYIREIAGNELVQIAYISSKEQYAMELFYYRPINFLVKPITEHDIRLVIDKYCVIKKQFEVMFSYKKGWEFFKIPLFSILYFSNYNRKVTVVYIDQNKKIREDTFYDSIDSIYERVGGKCFLHIHKSIIVNYNYITKIGYESVIMMDNREFSISQSRRKAIRQQVMQLKRSE